MNNKSPIIEEIAAMPIFLEFVFLLIELELGTLFTTNLLVQN